MSAAKSYAKPVEVGATMVGGTVGEVVASRNPNFAVGDIAVGYGGWQDYAVASGSGLAIPPNLIRRPRQSWTIRLSGTAMPTCVTDAGVRLASECRRSLWCARIRTGSGVGPASTLKSMKPESVAGRAAKAVASTIRFLLSVLWRLVSASRVPNSTSGRVVAMPGVFD
jgi:hypothetical protein